jgi:hypothetical protein
LHLVQHVFEQFVRLGDLRRISRPQALLDVMLERHLGEMDIIGRDEDGIVDVDGIIDHGALLLTREQAEREIDQQEADRQDSQLAAERSMESVGRPSRTGRPPVTGNLVRPRIDLGGGHADLLRRPAPSWKRSTIAGVY